MKERNPLPLIPAAWQDSVLVAAALFVAILAFGGLLEWRLA